MKHKTKLLALMLAVVTVFTATALVACTPEDLFSNDSTDSETEISSRMDRYFLKFFFIG